MSTSRNTRFDFTASMTLMLLILQNEVVRAANSIKAAHQAVETTPEPTNAELPDRNLPLSEQLAAALATLKRYTVQLFNQKVEIESLRKVCMLVCGTD